MLSAAYGFAHWAGYACGALALLALAAIGWRLRNRPRGPLLGPLCVLVAASLGCAAAFWLGGTAVRQVRLGSIRQLGLETRHAGLRSDAVVYGVQVSVPVALRLLPPDLPLSGVVNDVSGFLVHKTTTVNARVAVYGLIDFTALRARSAAVDQRQRTITVALPDPSVGQDTTYISAVDGVAVREGPLTAAAQSLTAVLDSLLDQPVVSFSAQPALARAKAVALARARRSPALQACGRAEIAAQLARIFRLVPRYRGYRLIVTWPAPAPAGVRCAALQRQLAGG